MSNQLPKISVLKPIVLADQRRVVMKLSVDNLPTVFANVHFSMPDLTAEQPTSPPPKPDPNAPSPYPNVELSILDSQGREVASLLIVEHKERDTDLTLHLRAPDPEQQYIARAKMTHQDKTLELVEVPFTLTQSDRADV